MRQNITLREKLGRLAVLLVLFAAVFSLLRQDGRRLSLKLALLHRSESIRLAAAPLAMAASVESQIQRMRLGAEDAPQGPTAFDQEQLAPAAWTPRVPGQVPMLGPVIELRGNVLQGG